MGREGFVMVGRRKKETGREMNKVKSRSKRIQQEGRGSGTSSETCGRGEGRGGRRREEKKGVCFVCGYFALSSSLTVKHKFSKATETKDTRGKKINTHHVRSE